MRPLRPILSLLCLLLARGLGAADPDIELGHTVTYRLTDHRGRLALSIRHEVDQLFLSARSTHQRNLAVFEAPFAEVKDLQAAFRGKDLSGDAKTFRPLEGGDIFISSMRRHDLNLPADLKPGERVSYSWTEQFLDPAFARPVPIPNVDRVERFSIVVEHPTDIEVTFEVAFPRSPVPYRTGQKDSRTAFLTFDALPWLEPLPFLEGDEAHAQVLPRFTRKGVALTPVSPEAFARWYLGLLPDMSLDAKVRPPELLEALAKAGGPQEKLVTLHDFVRERIRYAADEVGLNAIVPRLPATVLQRGYGDCKDKAFLVQALARLEGIPVDVVLVAQEPWAPGAPIHVGLFNHVICRYQDGPREVYFDPTYRDVPFGALPVSDALRHGFILDSAQPRMALIPNQYDRPWVDIQIKGQLAQPRTAEALVTLRGDFAALARRGRREHRALDLENELSNALNQHFQKLSLDHFQFEADAPDGVRYRAVANLEDFLVASTTRFYFPQVPFRGEGPDLLKRVKDEQPLDLAVRPWLRLELDIAAEGVQVKEGRVNLQAPGPTTFSASCEPNPAGARLRYELRPGLRRVLGPDRAPVLQFHEQLARQRRQMFIFTRSTP